MNEHTKELCHWGLSLGEKKQGHKYIARVEGKRPGSYIYFYDLDKYNRWKQGAKTKLENTGNKLKEKVQNEAKKASKKIQNEAKKARNKIQDQATQVKNKTTATLKNGNVTLNDAVNKYKKYISNTTRDVSNAVENKKQEIKKEAEITVKKSKEKAAAVVDEISKNVQQEATDVVKTVKKKADTAKKDFLKTDAGKEVSKTARTVRKKAKQEIKSFLKTDQGKDFLKAVDEINRIAGKKLIDFSEYTKDVKINTPVINYADKYRTGASGDEAKRQEKMDEYKRNEPAFMHSVPRIKKDANGNMPKLQDDLKYVNPDLKLGADGKVIGTESATVNCWHCSTAYDLRKRGYDVSATATNSHFGSSYSLGTMYDIETSQYNDFGEPSEKEKQVQEKILNEYKTSLETYKKLLKTASRPSDISTLKSRISNTENKIKAVEKSVKDDKIYSNGAVKDNKGNCVSVSPIKAISVYEEKTKLDTSKLNEESRKKNRGIAIATAMSKEIDKFPDNSWGRIGMTWENGGGHSIAWEKDVDGTIRFIDAQHNKVIDMSDYAAKYSLTNAINIERTDNLQIKEPALWFTKNTKESNANDEDFKDEGRDYTYKSKKG